MSGRVRARASVTSSREELINSRKNNQVAKAWLADSVEANFTLKNSLNHFGDVNHAVFDILGEGAG